MYDKGVVTPVIVCKAWLQLVHFLFSIVSLLLQVENK